ncbi:glycosyltransferase [Paracidovorax wautersii]|uniref:Glycosyltransferase involved in cell wall bisynthesis n=1 Tax=Paracidovorax wautersii TaxID=1177982 RepID=A0A1I2CL76_9BURK|nr:glycosyltransferase [Paracidovorax wautersii]SFE68543.1 Glycosyltransferase involved in cell wall bisynthesis [Paracidovorax wautersii]
MSAARKKTIAFIYHGSSGVPGGYSAKFIDGLANYAQVHAFVNCGYIYKHENSAIRIHKIFFPITDDLMTRKTLLRRVIRFFEFFAGYIITAFWLAAIRADQVIYSPITNFIITRRFVTTAKKISKKLAIVVHDSQSHYEIAEKNRDAIYLMADTLIVHNQHSLDALRSRLPVTGYALSVPFPWSLQQLPVRYAAGRANVLLIGHVRPSKGIDFLLEAFPQYRSAGGVLELAVTGSMPFEASRRIEKVADRVIDTTLDDQDFLDEIASSRFLILPYKPGYANSSVHYCAAIHCATPFICSNIKLFDSFENGIDCIKFEYGDIPSFISALLMAEKLDESARREMSDNALKKIRQDMKGFDAKIGKLLVDRG